MARYYVLILRSFPFIVVFIDNVMVHRGFLQPDMVMVSLDQYLTAIQQVPDGSNMLVVRPENISQNYNAVTTMDSFIPAFN
jgi:hypothetical protein